jgi:hypothetical protein
VTDARWKDQESTIRRAFARAIADMLVDDDEGQLAAVAIGRRLVIEATRTFNQYVARARAAGYTWEQIAERVPGYVRAHGGEAAEVLFTQVAGRPRPGFAERYVSWRCGDCEGLILDRGPYGGHPADAEPGHRDRCERLCRDIAVYVAGLEAYDEDEPGLAQDPGGDIGGGPTPVRSMHVEGPGLGL